MPQQDVSIARYFADLPDPRVDRLAITHKSEAVGASGRNPLGNAAADDHEPQNQRSNSPAITAAEVWLSGVVGN